MAQSKTRKNKKKYTALIIEPRKHKALEFVLKNFLENLSNESILLQIFKTGMYNSDLNKKLNLRLLEKPISIERRLANWALFIRSYFYDLLGNVPEDFFHLIPATKIERAEIKSIAVSL
jgi:hypothetical protein